MTERFYFEDRCGGEFQWHATQAEALDVAAATLSAYRKEAFADGEWGGDVEDIVVGRIEEGADRNDEDARIVTHRATAEGSEAEGFDYAMRAVDPGHAPAP